MEVTDVRARLDSCRRGPITGPFAWAGTFRVEPDGDAGAA